MRFKHNDWPLSLYTHFSNSEPLQLVILNLSAVNISQLTETWCISFNCFSWFFERKTFKWVCKIIRHKCIDIYQDLLGFLKKAIGAREFEWRRVVGSMLGRCRIVSSQGYWLLFLVYLQKVICAYVQSWWVKSSWRH